MTPPSAQTIRAVIDTNAVDAFAAPPARYEAMVAAVAGGRLDLLWTHINIDELAATPDEDRRAKLLCIAASLCRFVLTGTMVWDYSRWDFARWAGDAPTALEAVSPSGNLTHTRDGIIAATAEFEQADIVTNDARLTARATAYGIQVWTPDALCAAIGWP